jgi:oligoribonuclease NrnB/cAMP/cGMP phosphodiesterase (DHH superfamily)
MSEKIKLFSHTDLDGVACAILAKIAFGDENVDVEYCNYDDINEKVKEFFDKGLDREYYHVYITDISINESIADEIDKYGCGNWFLFDHHVTALGLNKYGWCNVEVVSEGTDIKTCGTELFYWELEDLGWFTDLSYEQRVGLGQFVNIVRNYDTWRWKEIGEEGLICKQINDLFFILGRDEFIEWTKKKICDGTDLNRFDKLDEKSQEMLDRRQKSIDRYVEIKNEQMWVFLDQFGKFCGIVFAEKYISELGNRLSEMHPELDYIAMIDMAYKKVSYRTIHDDINLGTEIAHHYGGGGHAKAAGSTFGEEVWYAAVGALFGGLSVEDESGAMNGGVPVEGGEVDE